MRIAHVTATFPPYAGGTGNVCYYNARELARRGHEVHVFTAARPKAAALEVNDGVIVHRLRPLVQIGNAPLLPSLAGALRGFHIIHLHYPFFGGETTALAAGIHRTPLIITYHNDVILNRWMNLVILPWQSTIGRFVLRSAARLLFTSHDYARASYIRPLLRGREQFITELPNGVDVAFFEPRNSSMDLRTRHHLMNDDFVVLLVAALDRSHYFKGINVFLKALNELPPKVKGVIVGDGDLKAAFVAEAERLGIRQRIIFAGRVADAELASYYRLADVTVLPSLTMGEAFGLTLVESLASGTPVIASNLPGVRTVVSNHEDGFLVEANNSKALAGAIQEILSDQDVRLSMGRQGRAKVESQYSWDHIGANLEAIYREVLDDVQARSQVVIKRIS